MTRRLALLAPIALAACGPATTPEPRPTPSPTPGGYIEKVQALPPGQLAGVLFRAIQKGGGQRCQGTTNVEKAATNPQGRPAWRVTCADQSMWLVTLADDGTAYVTGAQTTS